MAQDSSGRYLNMTVFNRAGCDMSLIYDRFSDLIMDTYDHYIDNPTHTYRRNRGWGSGVGYSSYPNNTSNTGNNNAITLESINYGGTSLVDRYRNLKVIATGDSTSTDDAASVYMAYYDDAVNAICYRNLQIGSQTGGTNGRKNQLYKTATTNTTSTASDGKNYSQYTNLTENTNNSATYSTGRNQLSTNATEFLDIGVLAKEENKGRVIIVYYNKDGKLCLLYSNNTLNGSNANATNIGFTENIINCGDNVGQYVSMAIDSNDGIHIAAFDSSDSDLKYIYLSSYTETTPTKEYRVDATGSVGIWTQIKMHNDIPYIAYYNSTETGGRDTIKLAYPTATAIDAIAEGIDPDDNYTTGAWEYMTVPALTPPQGGSAKFRQVCLDFSGNTPIVGYLGSNIEFGNYYSE